MCTDINMTVLLYIRMGGGGGGGGVTGDTGS